MANNCVRFKVENTPYDEVDINANWVNMNVGYDGAKFTIDYLLIIEVVILNHLMTMLIQEELKKT